METDINVREQTKSNVQFSAKLLSVVAYIGMIGAVLSVLPFVFTIDNDFPIDTLSNIGDKMTSIAELVFISLISYKIYKDGIAKPSYALLAFYAGVIGLEFIVNLISDEIGSVITIIYLVCTVGTGIIFLMAQDTKKIGMWLLLSIAGMIILASIVGDDGFENKQKIIGIALAALYAYPYAKYMEGCQKFLVGEGKE